MRGECLLPLGCLVAVSLMLTINAQSLSAVEPSVNSSHKLPKLFDFDQFKSLFGKKYGSSVEELSRKRYFFARAFKAFVTGTMYKFRRLSHYQAVNPMSDWSDEERERLENRAMAEEQRTQSASGDGPEEETDADGSGEDELFYEAEEDEEQGQQFFGAPDFLPDANEDFESEAIELIEEHASEPGFQELKRELVGDKRRRRKRAVAALPPRDFSFSKLLATPDSVREDDDVPAPKVTRHVASNNRHYEPIELASEWSLRDVEHVKWVGVRKEDPRPFTEQASSFLNSLDWRLPMRPKRTDSALGDEMFVDLRQAHCMNRPRSQNRCGSCYAFAAIAIMEFHYCSATGDLVEFSEQYMVDCGKGQFLLGSLSGCGGGTNSGVVKFLHNFGLETRRHYPYLGKQGQCPLDPDMDLKRTGYIRMPLDSVAVVPMQKWAEALAHGPLYVGVSTGNDFQDYGGGIYQGKKCGWFENHAMVLAGHGREDGQEFWLLRNSYGRTWGERGYFKLSKRYAKKCVTSKKALAFGTKDGLNYDWKPALAQPDLMPPTQANYRPKVRPRSLGPLKLW